MNNLILILIFVVICINGCGGVDKYEIINKKVNNNNFDNIAMDNVLPSDKIIPDELILDVPFVMQAPFANWGEHNESCEEAGILLAHYYYLGEELSKETADRELKDMVEYQNENYGGEFDIYASEMAKLAYDYYGYTSPRVFTGTVDDIKKELLEGNPIIVPTTAAYLKPEKSDYPEMGYHVVVIVGYNSRGFVTHDPGTYSGEDFTYSYNTILQSMLDYDSQVLVLK